MDKREQESSRQTEGQVQSPCGRNVPDLLEADPEQLPWLDGWFSTCDSLPLQEQQ